MFICTIGRKFLDKSTSEGCAEPCKVRDRGWSANRGSACGKEVGTGMWSSGLWVGSTWKAMVFLQESHVTYE